jgi:NCS1 family nucleobase:cation symporter-1
MPDRDGGRGAYSNKSLTSSSKSGSIDGERSPLLSGTSSSRRSSSKRLRRHGNTTTRTPLAFDDHCEEELLLARTYHSSDEDTFFDFIMEKVKETRFGHFLDKIAVEQESGLTNAQLMLNNHDLKPVEPERRQWGPWNFVGFWVADSFNIVGSGPWWCARCPYLCSLEYMDDLLFHD